MSTLFELSLEDKLYRTKYEPDAAHPHIKIEGDACLRCERKPCLRFCSGGVYKQDPSDPNKINISHENCLECGTCRYGCPFKAIDWQYPDGGMGVKFKYG